MLRPRLSVAGIVIIGLVATTTLLLGGMGYVGYNSFGARQREEFRQAHVILADQLATSLSLPLWNFDRDQIGRVIESAIAGFAPGDHLSIGGERRRTAAAATLSVVESAATCSMGIRDAPRPRCSSVRRRPRSFCSETEHESRST